MAVTDESGRLDRGASVVEVAEGIVVEVVIGARGSVVVGCGLATLWAPRCSPAAEMGLDVGVFAPETSVTSTIAVAIQSAIASQTVVSRSHACRLGG